VRPPNEGDRITEEAGVEKASSLLIVWEIINWLDTVVAPLPIAGSRSTNRISATQSTDTLWRMRLAISSDFIMQLFYHGQ
jgi:hypothetical protein